MNPEQLLAHYDDGSFWQGDSGLDVPVAYEHALTVRQLRIARGEKPRGYKIGFTNRTIWQRYNVFAPIWGTVWDTTLAFCEGKGEIALAGTCQPRLEPEAVFGIAATPPANATLDQLFECIEWVAPGFEIVQSHQPGWKFVVADTVADGALHARLLVGERIAVSSVAPNALELEGKLANSRVRLRRGDEVKDEGVGSNVLDGPLHALRHFLQAMRDCPGAPDLEPGDVVTTGTWTDAWPVVPGERWTAQFDAPLRPLEINFT
ncbi:MAG TPA: hydratase [Ramlibacter sp.]|nr:hydratase [Ramlibacter sp.]